MRRALGFRLTTFGQKLISFIDYLEANNSNVITTESALSWATCTARSTDQVYWWPYLITMDQYVAQQIAALDNGIRSVEFAGVALLLGLLVLAVQSLSILSERYSRRITVRRLFGAGFTRTYREPLLVFAAVWSFQLVGGHCRQPAWPQPLLHGDLLERCRRRHRRGHCSVRGGVGGGVLRWRPDVHREP